MQNEDTFIHSYCLIAGVGEATARSACIMFDALHPESHAASPIPGLAPLAKIHVSAASRKSGTSRTGANPA